MQPYGQYPTSQIAPGYAPQVATYPPAPQSFVPPAGYPMAPAYPGGPAGYPAPAAPVQPTAVGSLDAFYATPSGGSKAWVFHNRPIGTAYAGLVSRALGDNDVRQQTDTNTGAPLTYRDGSPKWVMVVPMLTQASPEYPEGVASWWCKGQARDELTRAMAEAGAPVGPPEAGAYIAVQLVGHRPTRTGNPAYQYRVTYHRPTAETLAAVNAAPVAQPAPPPAEMPAAAPALTQAPGYPPMATEPQYAAPVPAQPVYVAPGQPVPDGWAQQSTYAPSPQGQVPVTVAIPPAAQLNPVPQQYAAPVPAPQAMQAPAQPNPPAAGLAGLTADQQALMARLTGAGA